MKPDPFLRVAKSGDLVGAGPFALSADGVDVALVRTGAGWRAFQGLCPHQGALLGEAKSKATGSFAATTAGDFHSSPAGATEARSASHPVLRWNATGRYSSTSQL